MKLYVRRVFITDDCKELVPPYLRFLRGVIDSADLRSISAARCCRTIRCSPRIRNGVTKQVLAELEKKAKKEPEEYAKFWETFGAVLKEGLYEDFERREDAAGAGAGSIPPGRRADFARGLCRRACPRGRRRSITSRARTWTPEAQPASRRLPRARHRGAAPDRSGRRVLACPGRADIDDKPFRSITRGAPDFSEHRDQGRGKGQSRKQGRARAMPPSRR